jgi:hypothetical protein
VNLEQRWNGIDRRELKDSENRLSQCDFVYHKSHLDLVGNPDLSGEKQARNRLSYDTPSYTTIEPSPKPKFYIEH